MDKTVFEFNEISREELVRELNHAFVFNMTKEDLMQEKAIENKFQDDFGASAQKVDIFLIQTVDGKLNPKNVREEIDLDKCFDTVSGSGSGYYDFYKIVRMLDDKGVTYEGFLILTRTMSDHYLDKGKDGKILSQYFHICSEKAGEFLKNNPAIAGAIAKSRVKLGEDFIKDIRKQIEKSYFLHQITSTSYFKYMKILEEYENKTK